MCSPTVFLGFVRQDVFYRKSWYSTLRYIFFSMPEIIDKQKGLLRNFSTHWDNRTFDWKSWYCLPPHPPPPQIHKIIWYQKFCGTENGFASKIFGTVTQHISYRKTWYSPLGINFFVSEIINALRVHLRSFPVLRDKKVRQKIVTLPSWAENFSIPKISDTLKGSPTKIIGTEWQKIFDRKSWNYLLPLHLIHKIFRWWNTAQRGSPTVFFGTVRQQIFYRKSWFPLSGLKCSISWNFLKQKLIPLRKEPVLWDKNVLTENRQTASLHPHIHKSVGYLKYYET